MFAASLSLLLAVVPQVPPSLVVEGVAVFDGEGATARPLTIVGDHFASPTEPAVGALHVSLPGAFAVASLQDAHGHLLGLGTALAEVDLVGTGSFAEVVQKATAAAAKLPAGDWVLGRGWDQNDWDDHAMPGQGALSAAIPDHPVWLVRVDGHAGIANAAALRLAGITRDSASPSGGEILRDARGEPTGVLVDNAMDAVRPPAPSAAQVQERLLAAQQQCFAHGLTCVHDAGVTAFVLDQMLALHAAGRWRLRTYVMLASTERALIARGPWQTDDGLVVVRAVKAYSDGALGSRGAALLADYSDRPGYRGLAMMPKGALLELAQLCADHDMQLCVHAIGDRANRAVLDACAEVKVAGGLAARRFRIEHAQVIAAADLPRFRDLGVLPSMQPTHLTSDMPWAPDRLGPDRVRYAYAFKDLLDLGVVVPFGSDFPVESSDPRLGLFAAVTTRSLHGGPAAGFRPDQRLSRAQALRGFTDRAAYAMFAEDRLGRAASGCGGDLTVFDRNLLTCPEDELPQAKVLLTVVAGRVVYDARNR